jgi:hypothetical protein
MVKRLFAVVRYSETLKDKKNRKQGFQHNEAFALTKNLKQRDYEEAAVILDVVNSKVIKNRFNERPFEELWQYYIHHYGGYINQWLRSQAQ